MASSVDCGFSSAPAGTSSGLISASRIVCSVRAAASSKCPAPMTHRIRCWIIVFGMPALTL